MKMLYSNPDYVRKMAILRAKQLAMFPPAVPFEKPKKKKDEEEDDKDKYKSFDLNNWTSGPTGKAYVGPVQKQTTGPRGNLR